MLSSACLVYFTGHGPLKGDPTRRVGREGVDDGNGVRCTAGKAAGSERVLVNDYPDAFMARHFDSAPLRV
ncbi:hypothetical protein AMELA_G00018660 [Ameiurus melas]|uniref:Uncharacterized protein n=1 Tax=Ameiurus melas TaxID=219545 RepID=A0A7J6BBA3_AMEME|nr:hypothetical protein AMELA_G00018660 [Ameiurus melas]